VFDICQHIKNVFLNGGFKEALWRARLSHTVNGKGILRSIPWALPYHKLDKKCANMH